MPIARIFWDGNSGRDIHVLRGGFTRDLTRSLKFVHTDGSRHFADDYLVHFADVQLTFMPLFKGIPQDDEFVGDNNGITVNTGLGSVSVADVYTKNNFIIEATAKNDSDGSIFIETIRIQVHGAVSQVWLTPDQLIVRPALLNWQPNSSYYVGEFLLDANHNLQVVSSLSAQITNVVISDNVVTLTVNQHFAVGAEVSVLSLTTATFLNGATLHVESATPTQITANFTHADYASVDTGDAFADSGNGLSGSGPGAPAFATVANGNVTDNQLIWVSRIDPGGGPWVMETPYRFAVRAQFDDEVVGDITDGHGVTWAETSGHVKASSGVLNIRADDNVGDKFFITAKLPAELGGAETPLGGTTLEVGRRWADDPSPPRASIVAGGALPGIGDAENLPNVLMLSDGFRAPEDEDAFNKIVDTFVHHLKNNKLMTPFNLLSGKMNYWKALIAADQIKISFRSEMSTIVKDGQAFAQAIPAVKKPPDHGEWSLENLLYVAGLPVPGDAARDPDDIQHEWSQVLPVDPVPHLPAKVFVSWVGCANRTFLEEQDGFPCMSYGAPPAATLTSTHLLDLHEDRAGIDGLRALYRTLGSDDVTLADGRPVGMLWAGNEGGFRFDNRGLVVLISSIPGGRALNSRGEYIAVSTKSGDPYFPVRQVAGRNAYTLDLHQVPANVDADPARTVAHELGHSFGLGDEYEDFAEPFGKKHADPFHANLQKEADTQIQDPNDATKKIISGDQIQWNWHRIVAAAVVNGAITPVGLDTFQIPVIPDVRSRFSQGDTVRLRPRTWSQPLRKFGPLDVSGDLVITEPPANDTVVVRAVHAISAQAFPSGSLLYTPKPAPASVLSVTYPYAEIVAKNIKDAITTNKKPLTEVPCEFHGGDPEFPIFTDFEGREPVHGIPEAFLDMYKVVGLYSGGARFSCGIFHPTGRCMMRNGHEEQSAFCAVCRYIMVDMIAPEFHPDIDADYDKIYLETLGTFRG
jgi:hypothetical protein